MQYLAQFDGDGVHLRGLAHAGRLVRAGRGRSEQACAGEVSVATEKRADNISSFHFSCTLTV